ncbi:MAG: HEAT repeat domain-containing protein [Planctomycetota bacterium]|jgi:HEAT repeat protein|nr:HEAT repeat domain-containing protein [Planctomycetota bacterium]
MRSPGLLACIGWFALLGAASALDARALLDLAVDPRAPAYAKEYAESRLDALAGTSAGAFISAVENGGPDAVVAARLLGVSTSPDSEAALLAAAFGADPVIAVAAAEALGEMYSRLPEREIFRLLRHGGREPGETRPPDATEDWMELALREAKARSRFRAFVVRGLYARHARFERDGQTVPMPDNLARKLWEYLGDADHELKFWAVRAAGVSGSPQATERLASFLYLETDPRLLAEALRVLARLRPPAHWDAVERHAAHEDPAVSLEALAALAALGYPYAMFPPAPGTGDRCAAAFVRHPSTALRLRALGMLRDVADPRAEEYVVAALGDLSGPVRAFAARIAGEKRFANAPAALTILLNDSWPAVRGEAARALVSLGVVGVVPRMLDDLEGDNPGLRREAAKTLGDLGDARVVPHLTAALGSGDPELRAAALESLGKLGDARAGPAVHSLMRSCGDDALAMVAARALFRLYGDDPGDSASSRDAWARRNGMEVPADGR